MKISKVMASLSKLRNNNLLRLAGLFFLLGLALLAASTILVKSRTAQSEADTLSDLRKSAAHIRSEFSALIDLLERRQSHFQQNPTAQQLEEIFTSFQRAGLETAVEGVAWLDKDLNPLLWLGNVANLHNLIRSWPDDSSRFLSGSFIVQDRSSYFLVRLVPAEQNHYLALFELLAFQPQFQSTYLREFIRLKSVPGSGADINFWDHEQDTEALARFFSRTGDEYISQQTEEVEIRTLYFPLRNEQGQILATVTLNSLQLQRQRFALPALIRILAIVLAIMAFIIFTGWLYRSGLRNAGSRWLAWLLTLAGLTIIRVHLGVLARNFPASGWKVFTAERLGLGWPLGLAASPADLFISSLLFCALVYSTIRIFAGAYLRGFGAEASCNPEARLPLLKVIILGLASALSVATLPWFIREVVDNCNLNLLSFTLNPSSLLIYLGLFLVMTCLLLPVILFSRQILPGLHRKPLLLVAFLLAGLTLFSSLRLVTDIRLTEIAILFLFWLLLATASIPNWRTWALSSICLLLISCFSYLLISEYTEAKFRKLTENVLIHLVSSQKTWANMALRQSFSELQKRSRDLLSYFRNPADPELARRLWNLTLLSRLNWNSCLYLQSQDLKLLSSFGLNMPVFSEQTNDLPFSPNPVIEEQYLDILGQEKHFLVGYQDFRDGEGQGGRLAIWASLDPELLPFFYSANPYFELLRLNTLPSLQHFPLSLAIFNSQGQALFIQDQPGFALPSELQKRVWEFPAGFWSSFQDGQDRYRGFFIILDDDNTYVFYRPEKSWRRQFTDFVKLFFLLAVFLALVLVPRILRQGQWQLSGRSFSFRVYLAFLVTGLVPLFFFIFFSQTVMARLFADRFVQEATSRAYFARSILHDFISLQEQNEQPAAAEMPEDLVFWISSTLNNDVNLFKNGRLLSSSRREYFETGLLSEMLDGEAYFRLAIQNQPLAVSRKSFGRYSYQALTVPYRYRQDIYFLNLPFPFEKQEISQARTELFEFFLLASIFFILLIGFLVATIKKMVVVPINQLIRATREVGLGNLDVRVEHQARDELRSLVEGFNTMVENLRAHEKELAELSQQVAWTEMARKVAHEIKNPLTPIQLAAEHILKVHADRHPEFDRVLKESISYIISEVENLRKIAAEFMTIARESGTIREKFDLKDLVLELVQPFRETLADRIKFILRESGRNFELQGDRGKMKVAIRNVLINAIEAIRGSGRVEISLQDKGNELELKIRDTGCGIPEETVAHIFEPYFSTKEKGTGLGLPICKRIVEEHEGKIRLESQPGMGTTVTITLPRRLPEQ